jgi:hypothetical protein
MFMYNHINVERGTPCVNRVQSDSCKILSDAEKFVFKVLLLQAAAFSKFPAGASLSRHLSN